MKLRINDNIEKEDAQNDDSYIDAINTREERDNAITVEIAQGTSKKTHKPYECIKLTIGEWSTLVFPRSQFELKYIKTILGS